MFYSFFFFFFFLMIRRPPRSTLFPYTRSSDLVDAGQGVARRLGQQGRDENAQHRARKAARQDVDKDLDRKSTRLNSSHLVISYAVFCLKKKKNSNNRYKLNTKKHYITLLNRVT